MRIQDMAVIAAALLLGVACENTSNDAQPEATQPGKEKTIFVSNYPLYYLTSRMAPESAQLIYPIPDGIDPAFWRPKLEEVEKMAEYDLLILNGAGYEQWLQWVILPEERVVKTADSFRDQWITMEDAVVHSHGPDGEHSHGAINFNTWLDPLLAQDQARSVATSLISLFPEEEAAINVALEKVIVDLQEIDAQFGAVTSSVDNLTLFTSHPVYTYWGNRYDVSLVDFHWEPELFPSESEWASFDKRLEKHEVRWMLWEAEPDPRTLAELVKRRVFPIVFSAANAQPDNGDYMTVMKENLERLTDGLQRR